MLAPIIGHRSARKRLTDSRMMFNKREARPALESICPVFMSYTWRSPIGHRVDGGRCGSQGKRKRDGDQPDRHLPTREREPQVVVLSMCRTPYFHVRPIQ